MSQRPYYGGRGRGRGRGRGHEQFSQDTSQGKKQQNSENELAHEIPFGYKKEDVIDIDGGMLEGGKAGRGNPGLQAQHLQCINLVQMIYGGKLCGNYLKSTEIFYYPIPDKGHLKKQKNVFMVDTQTAGSVCLLLQIALPCCLFVPHQMFITLKGGTNASFAPQFDYVQSVLQ
ncbi:hypothetical protein RFI_02269, partial [Reticulomyxa filosa]